MKKKLLVGMMMAFVLSLGGCGSSETTDNVSNVSSGGKIESKKESKKKLDENDLVPSENVYLWASTVRTGTPNKITSINKKFTTLPLTEEYLNNVGEFSVDGIYTIFSDMIEYDDGYSFVWTEEDSQLYGEEYPKDTIYIKNINEDIETTKREMFDQGYWRLETTLDDHRSYADWNINNFKWDRFDHYIEVLGNPSYVRVPQKDAERLKTEGAKYYDNLVDEEYAEYNETPEDERDYSFVMLNDNITLVWLYDEYVLQASFFSSFGADEEIMGSVGRSVNDELFYYPRTQWNSYWSKETGENYVDLLLYDDYAEVYEIPELN